MPIPWLTVLQSVPWAEVLANAPKVAEGAKKLWGSLRGQASAPEATPARPDARPQDKADELARLQTRVATIEAVMAELHEQMTASAELIKALAEQNTQLIKHAELSRRRIFWLSLACAVAGLMAVVSLAVALSR
jgi:hypothetical protein